jgi:integral membrane sensor domain MASE1
LQNVVCVIVVLVVLALLLILVLNVVLIALAVLDLSLGILGLGPLLILVKEHDIREALLFLSGVHELLFLGLGLPEAVQD